MATLEQVYKTLQSMAQQRMTELGIHHDDWSDREFEFIEHLLEELGNMNE